MPSDERLVRVGDVELCVQSFGREGHPPILLIAGNQSSMDWWEDGFCERLAATGRFVVRYDSRDTGRSTRFPVGDPGYSGDALVHDAVGVLDGLRLPRAHVVGISSGGGIAQYLGVRDPDRVASLTLMSTTPVSPGAQHPDLPPPTEAVSRSFAEPLPDPDWSDRDAVVDYMVALERVFAGDAPVDPDRIRSVVTRSMERGGDMASAVNHWLAAATPLGARLGEITAPTLVLHGRQDPLFPYAHAEALAEEIPGARLHPLSGVGHQHPPPELWDEVVGAIAAHTASD